MPRLSLIVCMAIVTGARSACADVATATSLHRAACDGTATAPTPLAVAFQFDAGDGAGSPAGAPYEGVYSPGASPGVVFGVDLAFGATSTIVIELGGTTPGFADDNHDQINDGGALSLLGGALHVVPWKGYMPSPGARFTIITWAERLVGGFGSVTVDSRLLAAGVRFALDVNNPLGPGDITLVATAVPEAPAPLLAAAATLMAALASRRSNGGNLPMWSAVGCFQPRAAKP